MGNWPWRRCGDRRSFAMPRWRFLWICQDLSGSGLWFLSWDRTAWCDSIYIYICIYIDRQVDGWMEGWTEGWTDGWMDGCKDGWIDKYTCHGPKTVIASRLGRGSSGTWCLAAAWNIRGGNLQETTALVHWPLVSNRIYFLTIFGMMVQIDYCNIEH